MPYSVNQNKNNKNDRHRTYKQMNCMGYALKHKTWMRFSSENYKGGAYEIFERYGLTPVQKSDMVLGKCYVAYRFGSADFHFMFRNKTGHWRHKMGNQQAKSISQKKVFDKKGWGSRFSDFSCLYNSKVYLYEM